MSSLKRAFINPELCCKNNDCVAAKVCPSGAILKEDDEYYVSPICTGCRKCLENCPKQAIIMI